jgi:hypothetical protein
MLHLPDLMGVLSLHARMLPLLDRTFRTGKTEKRETNNYGTIDLWLLPECSLRLKPKLRKKPCTIQAPNQRLETITASSPESPDHRNDISPFPSEKSSQQ